MVDRQPGIVTRDTPISELPEFVTVDEAAIVLHVSRGLVYSMTQSGQLTSRKLGRLLRIPRSALETLAQNEARRA